MLRTALPRMTLVTLLSVLLAACGTISREAPDPNIIGTVIKVQNTPVVIRKGQRIKLLKRDPIYRRDLIQTGRGKIHIRLKDDSVVELGEYSEFRFDQYFYDKENERGIFSASFSRGTMKTSTGKIMSRANPTFEVRTPIAIIGVRGTVFWGGFIFGDNTLDVAMLKGKGVYVTNGEGTTEIPEAGLALTVVDGEAPGAPESWPAPKLNRALSSTEI